jgi:uncharacterized membrane protein
MSELTSHLVSPKFETAEGQRRPQHASQATRKALLAAGSSAIAFGLWKRRERVGWPAVLGGTVLLARGLAMVLPHESSCQVSQTINRSLSDVFAYCSEVKNWPAFMRNMHESFENFRLDGPGMIQPSEGSQQPKTATVGSSPDKSLQWTSKSDGQLHQGSLELHLAPGERGTEVHWRVHSIKPQRLVTELLRSGAGASMEQTARESLRALKQLLEAGELATTDGQPHGHRGLKGQIAGLVFRERWHRSRRRRTAAPRRVAS